MLDINYENTCSISAEANREYLESHGTDTEAMSDVEILQANTGSNVYLNASIKYVDAMEDLDLQINM